MKSFPMVVMLLLFADAASAAPPRYTVTDLGTLGGEQSSAAAINNQGQIVGRADTPEPNFHLSIFVWQNGRMRTAPGLDGDRGLVCAVNEAGLMAGEYGPDPEGSGILPVIFSPTGKMRMLGSLPATAHQRSDSIAEAINAKGQCVGLSNNQAFFWDGNRLRSLNPPPGFQDLDARAINDKGQAAGKAARIMNGQARAHAILWEANGQAKDLGVLPGNTDSVAQCINNKGQIAGWVCITEKTLAGSTPVHYRAFLWQNGKMRGLGFLHRIHDSKVSALNDSGQVVGYALEWDASGYEGAEAALLWQNGRVYDLNTLIPSHSGWTLQSAQGINDKGWIVGYGIHNGTPRGFLLTPVRQ